MTSLSIPIAKGGKTCIFVVEDVQDLLSALPAEVQMEVIGAGLEKFLNGKMSSSKDFPAPTKMTEAELSEASSKALARAEKNLEDLKKGDIKVKYDLSKAKAKPATVEDKAILSEARRAAIAVLKNRARAQGIKPLSAVPASKWTELALKEIANNPKYLLDAKAAIASRATTTSDLDLTLLNLLDPKLVEKAKAKSKKASADVDQLSAKQAGLPKPTGKGKVPPARPQQAQHTSH